MPYFWWQGTTIIGTVVSGYMYAPSTEVVDELLLKGHIALMRTKDCSWRLHLYRITIYDQIYFFEQLAILLHNGMQLEHACTLIAHQCTHPKVQKIVFDCVHDLHAGHSFVHSMNKWPSFFDTFSIQIITVGLKTGILSSVCTLLASYYTVQAHFRKKMRTILSTPLLTLLFMLLVGIVLIVFFVPHLAEMFKTMHIELPPSTKRLIVLSSYIQSKRIACMITPVCVIGTVFFLRIKQSSNVHRMLSYARFHLPFLRTLSVMHARATYFSLLSLLLHAHVPLHDAVAIIAQVTTGFLQEVAYSIAKEVHYGMPLSVALTTQSHIFQSHQSALLAIAHASNTLAATVQKLYEESKQNIDTVFASILFWTGPLLLLFIGMCTLLLIMAVYGPLLQFSFTIS